MRLTRLSVHCMVRRLSVVSRAVIMPVCGTRTGAALRHANLCHAIQPLRPRVVFHFLSTADNWPCMDMDQRQDGLQRNLDPRPVPLPAIERGPTNVESVPQGYPQAVPNPMTPVRIASYKS